MTSWRAYVSRATLVLYLLTATAQGSASCPVTEPLQIADTLAAVQGDVSAPAGFRDAVPHRLGTGQCRAGPGYLSRPLADVVEWLDWAAWHREGECKATIRRGRCRRRRMIATMTWTDWAPGVAQFRSYERPWLRGDLLPG